MSGSGHQVSQGSSIFDQRGQRVNYQYNAAGNINLGAVQDTTELASQLDLLKQELTKAREHEVISELTESKAKTALLEAIEEAKKSEPDKKSLLTYLGDAKDYLKDIAAIAGIVRAVIKAYEWVDQIL